MSHLIRRRLSSIAEEMARARTELAILREQLAFHQGVLEERRIDKLVAETPLADRDYRIAAQDRDRVERLVGELERSLEAMAREQDRLLEELFDGSR